MKIHKYNAQLTDHLKEGGWSRKILRAFFLGTNFPCYTLDSGGLIFSLNRSLQEKDTYLAQGTAIPAWTAGLSRILANQAYIIMSEYEIYKQMQTPTFKSGHSSSDSMAAN